MHAIVMIKFSYLKFKAKKFPESWAKIEFSITSPGNSFLKNIAHPLA